MSSRGVSPVMPAQAGIQVDRRIVFWIPAFAGMTIFCLENSPTPELNKDRVK
jgi:hypothetical protein